LVVAGKTSGNTILSSSELYHFDSGKWSQTGNLEFERYGHTATLLNTGKVLVVAGKTSGDALLISSEVYDR
jgi:large repetitive protein